MIDAMLEVGDIARSDAVSASSALSRCRSCFESPRNFCWHASCLMRVARQLGLHHLLTRKPRGGRKNSRAVR